MQQGRLDEGAGGESGISPPIRFGTDGWRGLIGRDFTFENVARVLEAYADLLNEAPGKGSGKVFFGYDRRFLSREAAQEGAAVLAAHGIPVKLSKTFCPTPAISCLTKEEEGLGGVVITASHNPPLWNGVKFKESQGSSASSSFTAKIEKKIADKWGTPPLNPSFDEGIRSGKIEWFDPRPLYLQKLRSQVAITKITKAGWRVLYDPLYGAGSSYLSAALETPIEELHHEENPSFGGLNPEPIEKNLGLLMERVREKRFDVGLATDGDADRIGAVDEAGNFVSPQEILSLILYHLISRGERGDVVKTVSTTSMIDRIAAKHHLPLHETPVGFKYICEKFLSTNALIGGEESGGIGIPSHVHERDGLLSALLLLEIMTERKKRLGELRKELHREFGPSYYSREDCHLDPNQIDEVRERLKDNRFSARGALADLKVERTTTLDGVKFHLADNAWLLLRASGTEPLVRLYAEAPSPAIVKGLLEAGKNLIGI